MPIRHNSSTSEAANALARIDRFFKNLIANDRFAADSGLAGQFTIDADADEIVAHLLDVARLVLDLVGDRVRPLVVDPAAAGALGEPDHLLDQVDAVLVLERDEVLADQRRARAMRHADALEVIDERVEVAVVEE